MKNRQNFGRKEREREKERERGARTEMALKREE